MKQNDNTAVTCSRMFISLAIAIILLPACSNNPFRSDQTDSGKKGRIITVTSSPAGATVRANGTNLGETPLKVNIDKSFPYKWMRAEDYGVVRRVSGKLTIEKNGCDEYTVPVSHAAPADDINVTLVCTGEKPTPTPAETADPGIPEDTERRLKKLGKLHRDGIISTDEYQQHRDRILGEL